MKIRKANRGEAGGGQATCENQYRLRSSCVVLRMGLGLRQYIHFYFLHGVRVHCAPKILKRGLTLQKEPSQWEPLKDFENTVFEFSCLEVDSGSNVEDGWGPRRRKLQQLGQEKGGST